MQLQGDLNGVFANISTLIESEIPAHRANLSDNVNNLEKVAQYCEDIYVDSKEPDKLHLLNETKGYTTQALASVAYQVSVLANSFIQLLDNQSAIIDDLSVNLGHLSHEVNIHKEKVARREIGVLTTNKSVVRTSKVKKPDVEEKSVKYVRKPIDYSCLDDIGHGVKLNRNSGNSVDPLTKIGVGRQNSYSSTHSSTSGTPNIPVNLGNGLGTVRSTASGAGSYYRTPVAPPSVPSEYLSRQELGIYSSKKELNQSAGAESLSASYGGPLNYRRQLSNNNNNTSMQGGNEYSGMETLDRRMTSNYLQQLSYAMTGGNGAAFNLNNSLNNNNNGTSVGYASGKEIGLIRTNLNNIDYATNGTMYRRPQLHNANIYDRSAQQQQQQQQQQVPPVPPPMMQQQQQHQLDQANNLLRMTAGLQANYPAQRILPMHGGAANSLPPPPPALFSSSMHADDSDYSDRALNGVGDDDDDIIPNWVPIDRCLEKVITTYDYEGTRDDELSFKENTYIYVLKRNDDEWYEGIMQSENGQIITGLYPSNFARVVRLYVNDPRISQC